MMHRFLYFVITLLLLTNASIASGEQSLNPYAYTPEMYDAYYERYGEETTDLIQDIFFEGHDISESSLILTDDDEKTSIVHGSSSQHTITVSSGNHHISLYDVQIDVSYQKGIPAIYIAPGASVNLYISGNCSLKAGSGAAAIQVPEGAHLSISSHYDTLSRTYDGHLIAIGGKDAAGIGSGKAADTVLIEDSNAEFYTSESYVSVPIENAPVSAGSITITSASVHAQSSITGGAGIGGGSFSSGGHILIKNSDIISIGGYSGGAGIGGGACASGGIIDISDSHITARGSYSTIWDPYSGGAGIGGGAGASSGIITIQNSVVTTEVAQYTDLAGAGIGGGAAGTADEISISNSIITAIGGPVSAGIGSGANAACGPVRIADSVVTACGGIGIGHGIGGTNTSAITINNSRVMIASNQPSELADTESAGFDISPDSSVFDIPSSPYSNMPYPRLP